MHFEPDKIYHIYNQGINEQLIFHSPEHYHFFLKKISIEWLPYATILAYCLLPTQFHFIVVPNEYGCIHLLIQDQISPLQRFSRTIGSTLSSYTKAVNKQLNRRGGLFHKKTLHCELHFSETSRVDKKYLISRIILLHNKPLQRGITKSITEWQFSSAREYKNQSIFQLCDLHKLPVLRYEKQRSLKE